MKARVKTLDSRFLVSFCLLAAWVTIFFAPANSSNFLYKSAATGASGTVLISTETAGDTFGPSDLFKASLSKLTFKKSSPTAKFLPVSGGFVTFMAGHAALHAFQSAPVRDFFLFSPPNKASP